VSDVDAVIGLLERWRDASGMQRVRIGIDATRTVGALPADRKRALATEVARRVAPQLVPAIESETGDLSSEQVTAVIDLLRRADREQLDDLIGALKSGDVLGALELVDGAADIVAPDEASDAELLEDIGEENQPTAPAQPADEVVLTDDEQFEIDEEAIRERLRAEAVAKADRWSDQSEATSRAPAYRAPAMDFGLEFDIDDPDMPAHTVETVAPTVERGPVTAVLAAITATPDGYRRRRAAMAAIREHRLEAEDVGEVVRSFSSLTDRAWVAGAALDAHLIGTGELSSFGLSPPATARLARRADLH